jgi:HD-GYP domain-containing protein (c-di-GMP phosphodiesterase class II)
MLLPLPFFLKATPLIPLIDERVDGSGPRALKGDEIPLLARILAIAATFDTLVSGAPGTPALSAEEALSELQARKGGQLDGDLVERFAAILASQPEAVACPK